MRNDDVLHVSRIEFFGELLSEFFDRRLYVRWSERSVARCLKPSFIDVLGISGCGGRSRYGERSAHQKRPAIHFDRHFVVPKVRLMHWSDGIVSKPFPSIVARTEFCSPRKDGLLQPGQSKRAKVVFSDGRPRLTLRTRCGCSEPRSALRIYRLRSAFHLQCGDAIGVQRVPLKLFDYERPQ